MCEVNKPAPDQRCFNDRPDKIESPASCPADSPSLADMNQLKEKFVDARENFSHFAAE